MKKVSWIFLYPLAVVIIVLAVSNRGPVHIDLWPVPVTMGIPLYWLLFGALVMGIIWGSAATWISGGQTRKATRDRVREVRSAETEIRHLKDKITKLEHEARMRGGSDHEARVSDSSGKTTALLPTDAA